MCVPKNIKLLMMIMNGFKGISFILFIVFGAMIASNDNYKRAFGEDISGLAGGIIGLAFVVPFSTFIGHQGTKMHNKFLLLIHAMIEGLLIIIQLTLALTLMGFTIPDVDAAIRNDCSVAFPQYTSDQECSEWFRSDRYAAFKLVWAFNFEYAMVDQSYFSYLSNFQIQGSCCGYASPLTCEVDERSYPAHLFTDGVESYWLNQRTTCGRENNWYQPSGVDASECDQPIDPNALVLRYGGCRYEMPIGDCLNTVPFPETSGCAFIVEEQLNSELSGQASFIIFLTFFEIVSMITACCYCMKRKDEDRLPPYILEVPVHPAVATTSTAPQQPASSAG